MYKKWALWSVLFFSSCATTPRSPLVDPLPGQPLEWTEEFQKMHTQAAHKNADAMIALAEFYLFGPPPFQHHVSAYPILHELVERGNHEAMEILAGMYLNGRGVEQDGIKAIALYERGAVLGHGPCQFNAGALYKDGEGGVLKNPEKAYYWLSKAAFNPDLENMRYDAASLRNDVPLSSKERTQIIQKIYSKE